MIVNQFFRILLLGGVLAGLSACARPDISVPPKGYRSETTLKMAYAVGALKLIETSPEAPAELVVDRDLVYKETPEKTLKLDIYRRKTIAEPTPLLIFIHGGSWKSGDKDDYRRYLVDYAQKGYVTATVSYRLAQEAPFPAALDDAACAVRWLKENAGLYQIDTNRIALVGGSAGGHLAMMLGYRAGDPDYLSDCPGEAGLQVRAIVNLYGPVDLTTEYARNHPSVINFIGKEYSEETAAAYRAASPSMFITPDDPPTLIFHGTLDSLVPVSQADTLDAALRRNRVPVDYHRLKGWPHTMDLGLDVNRYCQYQMDAFFARYLDGEK